ncbi:poly(A)-binding protein binding protein [Malassezia cuniculi]|uniref:Poly(A)-binding protein binding protein n=1 Tax=Malassezia cuniculi TaxID=948313 RepID=A0AAF0EU33_9BASI|nr:poly(A)-binding protein binding protein [Malassezia cuniculi]
MSRGRSGSGNNGRWGNSDAGHPAGAGAQKGEGDKSQPAGAAARISRLVDMLVGQMVVVVRGDGERLVGVLSSGKADAKGLALVLSSAQTVTAKDSEGIVLGPIIPRVTIAASDVREIDASNVRLGTAEELAACIPRSRSSGFRTDTEISRARSSDGGRALQRWDDNSTPLPTNGGLEETTSAGGWDQFAANEAQFGIKSNYEETIYTTKLDKSGQDFKQREREAERLAKEILAQSSANSHVAEERGVVDDSGMNEEDKYGAVVRGSEPRQDTETRQKGREASASTNASANASASASAKSSAPSSKALTADFREFVSAERERLFMRKAELAKKEKQSRLADLKAWAQSFQLKTPAPREPERKPEVARVSAKDIKGIPPFDPERARARQAEKSGTPEAKPGSSKLNVHATSFNPGAAVFKPGGNAPKPTPPPAHPFFGQRELKNRPSSAPLRIRDDFKVWKMKKVPEAATVAPLWPYTGRLFRQHFVVMPSVPMMPVFGEPGPMPIVGMYPDGVANRPIPPQGASPPLPHMVYQPYPQYSFGQPPFIGAQGPIPVSAQGSPVSYKMSPHMVPFPPMARPPNGAAFGGAQDYGNAPRKRGKEQQQQQRTEARDGK